MFWKLIFNPLMGIFNYLIGFWNPSTAPIWLKDYALISVVIVDVWMWSPVRHAALPLRPQGHP